MWKNHRIFAGLTLVLVMGCVGIVMDMDCVRALLDTARGTSREESGEAWHIK